jgi:hypothetical protein
MSEVTLADVDHENHAHRGEFDCAVCIEHIRRFEAALEDLQNAERRIRILERQLAKARNDLAKQTEEDPRIEEAREVFEFWREHCHPKAREFSGARRQNVIDRLNAGYTVKQLKLAVYGAARKPNRSPQGEAFDELELICRSPHKTDSFIKRGWAALQEERERNAGGQG